MGAGWCFATHTKERIKFRNLTGRVSGARVSNARQGTAANTQVQCGHARPGCPCFSRCVVAWPRVAARGGVELRGCSLRGRHGRDDGSPVAAADRDRSRTQEAYTAPVAGMHGSHRAGGAPARWRWGHVGTKHTRVRARSMIRGLCFPRFPRSPPRNPGRARRARGGRTRRRPRRAATPRRLDTRSGSLRTSSVSPRRRRCVRHSRSPVTPFQGSTFLGRHNSRSPTALLIPRSVPRRHTRPSSSRAFPRRHTRPSSSRSFPRRHTRPSSSRSFPRRHTRPSSSRAFPQ